jgi:hypothetical protein
MERVGVYHTKKASFPRETQLRPLDAPRSRAKAGQDDQCLTQTIFENEVSNK